MHFISFNACLLNVVIARGQDSVKHYTVTANGGGFTFGLAKFANITQFVDHFENQPLVGGESGNSKTCSLEYLNIEYCVVSYLCGLAGEQWS